MAGDSPSAPAANADATIIDGSNSVWVTAGIQIQNNYQRRGVGSELVRRAIEIGVEAGGDWMHVDSDEVLVRDFHGPGGFQPTPAGLVNLRARVASPRAAGRTR
jgi:predicted N-acetyltransferase YhbS